MWSFSSDICLLPKFLSWLHFQERMLAYQGHWEQLQSERGSEILRDQSWEVCVREQRATPVFAWVKQLAVSTLPSLFLADSFIKPSLGACPVNSVPSAGNAREQTAPGPVTSCSFSPSLAKSSHTGPSAAHTLQDPSPIRTFAPAVPHSWYFLLLALQMVQFIHHFLYKGVPNHPIQVAI